LGRHFIGLERERSYADAARARIARVRPLARQFVLPLAGKRAEPRIPFGTLIEAGLLEPGAVLTDSRGRVQASVCADGSLFASAEAGGHRGSIHKVGALVQGAEACNGWTYWHYEREGTRRPIDELRAKVRAAL
ncbi:MAG: modification methylase, partial [Reyranella sp.]